MIDETDDTTNIDFSDDPVVQELQSCSLIYPHLHVDYDSLTGCMPFQLHFEEGVLVTVQHSDTTGISHTLAFLPPLILDFAIAEGYPHALPPKIRLKSLVLPQDTLAHLTRELEALWESTKDLVIFSIIDHVLLRTLDPSELIVGPLSTSVQLFEELFQADKIERQHQFDSQTFACEICQSDHKGISCFCFPDCSHTFCKPCLQSFFLRSICEGEVGAVHCPSFECTRAYTIQQQEYSKLEAWMCNDTKVEKIVQAIMTPPISMQDLDQIFTGYAHAQDLIGRFSTLFVKSRQEMIKALLPSRLVDCPRDRCPQVIFRSDLSDPLVICDRCSYAFCNDCHKSWHGRFVECKGLHSSGVAYRGVPLAVLQDYIDLCDSLSEKKVAETRYGKSVLEKAVKEYEMDTLFQEMVRGNDRFAGCPCCHTTIEKTDGCNKVLCVKCNTVFCFHCGDVMENNYDHYNDSRSLCYRKLFVGMPGSE